MTNEQIDKWAVEHSVLTHGVEWTRNAARDLLKTAGFGAPSFPAQQVSLTQPGPGKKIKMVLELDAIEPAKNYLVIPINPAVVREKSAEQMWREAATRMEMANAELSRAYAELKRQVKKQTTEESE